MGYQVGNQCFSDLAQAENHYFSLVAPVIKPDGTLLKPEFSGNNWSLNGQVIHANLPQCDPLQNLLDGVSLGWLFFGAMAAMFSVTLIIKLLR